MAKLGREARKRRGRAPKVRAVEELTGLLKDGDGIVFMNNNGLSLAQATAFRTQLRANNVAVKVAKNTLIKIALKGADIDPSIIEDKLVGPTMIAIGLEDPISPAKCVMKFLKDNEEARLEVKGGILKSDEKALDANGVEQLSKLPGREEMIAMLLGSLNAPAQNMVYALNASVSQFAWALSAHQRNLEAQG